LAIYYGWPSAFDGAGSVEEAAAKLARYDAVVLGSGLQQPDHGDHQGTLQIISRLTARAEVFGYIPLGKATGLSADQIVEQIDAWRAMGVTGIFFDEAGYDFGNTRQRQNDALEAAHGRGLAVFANSFDPDDIFDPRPSSSVNPGGRRTRLRRGDLYLYESFGLVLGKPESAEFQRQKTAKLERARALGVRVFAVTTSPAPGHFDGEAWRSVVEQARRLGLDGIGWGEYLFAAQDNRMPFRTLPEVSPASPSAAP
jgi:hypothetical protein